MEIHRFESLDSTNVKARDYDAGSVIISEEQTEGKGRFKREWSSGKGGVYLSIVIEAKVNNAKFYTFIAAIAAQHAIKKITNVETKIKWQKTGDLFWLANDLMWTKTAVLTRSPPALIIRGLDKSLNWAKGLGFFDTYAVRKLSDLKENLELVEAYDRKDLANQIETVKQYIASRAEEYQSSNS